MHNEEIDRQINFIVGQQAQFSSDIDAKLNALVDAQIRTEENLARTQEHLMRTDKNVASTDESLKNLIGLVDRYLGGRDSQ